MSEREPAVSPAEEAEDLKLEPAVRIIEEMSPITSSHIIPLLQRLQDAYGYLPREVVLRVAERTGLPASRMYGVATFYARLPSGPAPRGTS